MPIAPDATNGNYGVTADAPLARGARGGAEPADDDRTRGVWIGASAEGDLIASETRETFVGVWVDVPRMLPDVRPPMDLALVIDTSGSMAGPKIENARVAAAMLVRNLRDGDIVALDTFSTHARTLVPPTRLDATTRTELLRAIASLDTSGSTNMFDGLSLGENQVAAAPASHTLRRVVVISDGKANVGPSSPDVLGALAERGLLFRAQVTSLGVGSDYDERTLDALAVRSSGRMYHLGEPREMASTLQHELEMLDATLASDASVEIVPAPGVVIEGADGVRTEWRREGPGASGGESPALRIPLGALHAGQHREALVRVRITDPTLFEGHARPLASVRLRFRDAQEGDLERIQEAVARTQLSGDPNAVARTVSSRAKAIFAIQQAAKTQLEAAQRINDGDFVDADKELAKAQAALAAQAQLVTTPAEKKRLDAVAGRVATARASAQVMPTASPAARREGALKLNADAMHDSGF